MILSEEELMKSNEEIAFCDLDSTEKFMYKTLIELKMYDIDMVGYCIKSVTPDELHYIERSKEVNLDFFLSKKMGYKTFKAHTMKKEKREGGRLSLYKIILVGEFRDKLSV